MSHPTIERLGPSPRYVPLLLRCHLAFGSATAQFGWVWLSFTSIFFWLFFMDCEIVAWPSFIGNMNVTQGTVTRADKTHASEGGTKHSSGTPIYANHYTFKVQKTEYSGCSYATGMQLSPGQNVTIEYKESNPTVSRIQGMRSRTFGAMGGIGLIFPLLGVLFVMPSLLFGRKARQLLEYGQLSKAVLKSKKSTNTRVNNQTVYKLTFEYSSAPGRVHTVSTKTPEPRVLEDEPTEQILFDPENPDRAVLVDQIGDRFTVDEMGSIHTTRLGKMLMVSFMPFLTMCGNIAFLIYRQM